MRPSFFISSMILMSPRFPDLIAAGKAEGRGA